MPNWPLLRSDLRSLRKVAVIVLAIGLLILWDVTFVWWMGDGLEDVPDGQRVFAEELLSVAPATCLDHPILQILSHHLYVWVGDGPMECREPFSEPRGGFMTGRSGGPPERMVTYFGPSPTPPRDVYVDVYTVLGLPLARITQKACGTELVCRPH